MQKGSAVELMASAAPFDQKVAFLKIVLHIHMDILSGRPQPEIELFGRDHIPIRSIVSRPTEIALLLKTLFSARFAMTQIEILRCGGVDDTGEAVGLMFLVEGAPVLQLGATDNGGIVVRQMITSEASQPGAKNRNDIRNAMKKLARPLGNA